MTDNHDIKVDIKSKMPNEMTDKEKEEFMSQPVTRREVTNFVDGYINNEVIPQILNTVGKELFLLNSKFTVLLKYLIDAGICTKEQFFKDYAEFVKHQQELMKNKENSDGTSEDK